MSGAQQGMPWWQLGAGAANQQIPGQVGAGNYGMMQQTGAPPQMQMPSPQMQMPGGGAPSPWLSPNLAMFAHSAQTPMGQNYLASILQAMQAGQQQQQQAPSNIPSPIGWTPPNLGPAGTPQAPINSLGPLIAAMPPPQAPQAPAAPAQPQGGARQFTPAGGEIVQVPQLHTPTQSEVASGFPTSTLPQVVPSLNGWDGRG